MRRNKKFILIALLTIVVLAGSIGGAVFANTDDGDDSPPKATGGAFLDKVCEIYNAANPEATINSEELQKAFEQAKTETMIEARDQFRQRLIDEEQMTEEQLDELEKWMESRPDFPADQFKEWLETRPDIPFPFRQDLLGDAGHRGFGKFGGRFPRWGGPCAPQTTE